MSKEILNFSSKLLKHLEPQVLIAPTQGILRLLRKSLGKERKLLQGQLLADAIPLYHTEGISVIGPCLGASACMTALEPLLHKGAQSVTLIGFAGGLIPHTQEIGDIVQANSHLNAYTKEELASEQMANSFHVSIASSLGSPNKACVASIDNPYQESQELVSELKPKASLIEMESFAACSSCLKYDSSFCAFFVISDVWGDDWKPGFGNQRTLSSMSRLLQVYTQHC
jgi:nucleoside phosphorylase